MSTLYVDNLEPNLGSQVEIPDLKPLAGSVVQVLTERHTTFDATTTGYTNVVTKTFTPKYSNSLIIVRYNGQLYKYNTDNYPNSDARIMQDQGTGTDSQIVKHPYITYNDTSQYMYSLSMAGAFNVTNTGEHVVKMQIDPKGHRAYIYNASNLLTIEEIAQ